MAQVHAGPAITVDSAFRLALQLHQGGSVGEAARLCRQILGAQPAHVQAWQLLGMCLVQGGEFAAALDAFDRARHLGGPSADLLVNLGVAFQALGRLDDAVSAYGEALAVVPVHPVALNNRANVLRLLGRFAEAAADYDAAIQARPGYATALAGRRQCVEDSFNRGVALHAQGDLGGALNCYDLAVTLDATHVGALNNRGNIRFTLGDFEDAASDYGAVLALDPNAPYAAGQRLYARMSACAWEGLDDALATVTAGLGRGERVIPPFALLALPCSSGQQLACARIYARDKYPSATAPFLHGRSTSGGRIRIGYFSADFHEHATSQLMAGLFERHDRARFEIHAFSFGPPIRDAMRARLVAAFDRFDEVGPLTDAAIADLARQREIGIAVDLKGYTALARPGIFACRAAPVQVSHLGYPGTMGVDFIDYLIADPVVLPPEDARWYNERIAWLPDCYQVNDSTKRIATTKVSRRDTLLPENAFVFCCFNNSYKITPDVFDIWMRLLRRIEGSVLWLLDGGPAAQRNLQIEAGARGVDSGRLVFAERLDLAGHLARHQLADLFLDTFHYNAHTTASDALWAGLPVLTCRGGTFAGRVGASLLAAIGVPELVAATPAEYEAMAVRLATHPDELAVLRRKISHNHLSAPLFDTAKTTREIEAAYLEMWRRHEEGLAPAPMRVGG